MYILAVFDKQCGRGLCRRNRCSTHISRKLNAFLSARHSGCSRVIRGSASDPPSRLSWAFEGPECRYLRHKIGFENPLKTVIINGMGKVIG